MTTLPALTLYQPWASLCVTRQLCDFDYPTCSHRLMVKSLETRSRRPPAKLVGQRILIHAAKRKPTDVFIGDWSIREHVIDREGWKFWLHSRVDVSTPAVPLPLGAIVGSAVLGEPLPIVRNAMEHNGEHRVIVGDGPDGPGTELYRTNPAGGPPISVTDQYPHGDWSDGRWAWPLHDAAPTTELCPNCDHGTSRSTLTTCNLCEGTGQCDPIPAQGRQQIGWPCDLEAVAQP